METAATAAGYTEDLSLCESQWRLERQKRARLHQAPFNMKTYQALAFF